jgi:ribonuclease D
VRLLQVAARVGDEIVCGVVDCYQVAPKPLLRLLADGREIIAHNARYEQAWLTFHYGLPTWRSIFDTSCAFRVFERHWSIQDPGYDRRDATLATVTRRLLGAPKGGYGSDWWGAEPLPAEQLDYAAYDAVALLHLRDLALELATAFGCTDQVLAASRTACIEAFRRLPQPYPDAWDAACGLIEAARDDAALARAAAVIRHLPLAAWQRAELRERYAVRRLALAA